MYVASSATTIDASAASQQSADLDDIHAQSALLLIRGVAGLGYGVLVFGTLVLEQPSLAIYGIAVGLVALSWLAHLVFARSAKGAAGLIVGGLATVLTAALILFPEGSLASWFAVLVFIAGALLGWRWSLALTLAVVALLSLLSQQLPGTVVSSAALSAGMLSLLSLVGSWIVSRPTITAVGWAWHNYQIAAAQTAEARARQAELARLSKALRESTYHLKQINLDLNRAEQAAQEARRLKAQFATSVSHELRTPLNLIIGFCEMMVLSPSSAYGQRLPTSYQEDLKAVYRNACHISALVDDILDLSQIEADRMGLHKDWTPIRHIVDEAVATVEALFLDRGLTLRTEVAEDLPLMFVDQTRIRQILINLLANAARCTDEGGATVRAQRTAETVVLSVADTGPGIPASDLRRVFDEFRQSSGTPWQRAGSGLGLTVSKRFAELHGGAMWVESVLGAGSTFSLALPLGEEAQPVPLAGPDWSQPGSGRARGQVDRRILVVDESDQVHKVFERYLDGYHVLHTTSLEKGRKLARREPVHALVLGSDGIAGNGKAGQLMPPELRRVPIISCPLRTPRRVAQELGVADYLLKPVTRDQLRAALRRLGRPIRGALVVDDDAEMTRLLGRMLHALARGCQVSQASDGRTALALLREQRPDVLLLDLLMPEMDGYGLLEAMRQDPALAEIPVLVVTAWGAQDEAVVAGALSITRSGGLSVAEVMRWVSSGLDSLFEPHSSGPAPPAAPSG